MRLALIALASTLASTGCGLTSNALDMELTAEPATASNFDALAQAASQIGWQPVRGRSSTDWPLTVYVSKGEKILVTENIQTNTIGFTCDGDRLDDDDRCLAEVNKMWNIAFGHVLVDD